MSTPEPPSFLFVVCQAGAESTLKREFAREHPELRFAFSRPGFLTFKRAESKPSVSLRSVFARAWGESLGAATKEPGTDPLPATFAQARALAEKRGAKLRLHVFERDLYPPGEEPPGFEPGARARSARERLLSSPEAAPLFLNGSEGSSQGGDEARAGETVFDVIVIEENQWWLGTHEHDARRSPWPGSRPPLTLPEAAPSRAWLKLEEGVRWANLPLKRDDIAVEIGAAPGGAVYALLQRGLKVVGIDPGKMAPVVMRHSPHQFQHLATIVNDIVRENLPHEVQWLLLDMNIEPRKALKPVERLVPGLRDSLLGVILTFKLNDWRFAEDIPTILDRLRALGLHEVRATQLPSNKQEFFACGLTGLGRKRRSGG